VALSPEERYSTREQEFRGSVANGERRSRTLSRARLAVFFFGAALLVAALQTSGPRLPWLVGLAVAGTAFLLLVIFHQRVEDRLEEQRALADVNRDALARVRRQWRAIPALRAEPAAPTHPFAADLDILGPASLLQLLSGIGTPDGIETMRAWLLAPAPTPTIERRQAAVTELAAALDFRQALLARALQASKGRSGAHDSGLEQFFAWAEESGWFISRPWLVWLTRLLSAAAVALAVLQATGVIQDPLWLAPTLVNVVLWFVLVRRIEHTFNRAFARDSAPGREARMFEAVERQRIASDLMRELQRRSAGACRAMRRLQRLMELADIRFTTLVHFPLNALTLWDFHVLAAVERWQRAWGRHMRDWFLAVGEIEALSALAGLLHDNPAWSLPAFANEPIFEAIGLGHPLLPERSRVANDVKVGPPGTFLFVTGSNMSGKSTLLRAIGVNAALAQAGGPVCARSLRMPPAAIATSMRVQDSLEEGVSYFLAALQRLKQILAYSREPEPDERVLLYLLDEILQGTNTAERQIAVRTILGQLLTAHAIGAVTSHDLNLADEEPLARAAVPVHFEEHFEGQTMTFDYRLRPGVATSRNALKLMTMIGIEPEPLPPSPAVAR
jgi:ABC-type multidrug transport system fused ATPase/permease subunit